MTNLVACVCVIDAALSHLSIDSHLANQDKLLLIRIWSTMEAMNLAIHLRQRMVYDILTLLFTITVTTGAIKRSVRVMK
ncbi:hypothetical protein AZE42_13133, partial [Rhizopogon vesiculosus]